MKPTPSTFSPELLNEVAGIMEATAVQSDEGLQSFIEKSKKIQSIVRLPGDASTRRYYRVTTKDQLSLIVMVMEPFEDVGEKLNFIAIQKHLKSAGVDVPTVLDFDAKNGFIMLEDLGDTTLLRCLQEVASAEEEAVWFKRAIDELVKLHTLTGPEYASDDIAGFGLKFDHQKLMWEIDFTIEHFYQKHLLRDIPAKDLETIRGGFSQICFELERQPTVFTHRDYHSRNVMIPEPGNSQSRFVMIDFQDARMGPCQYDLASLLKDSYYQLEERQVTDLVNYYCDQMESAGKSVGSRDEFRRVFDLMAIQRNFKAIGSFASFLNRRGNPAYLKFIGNTFENIRRNLMKYPEFKDLREALFHYYYF